MEMGVCSFVLTGACSCDLTQYWAEPEADRPGLEQPHCFPCGCISSGRYLSSVITHTVNWALWSSCIPLSWEDPLSWLGFIKRLSVYVVAGTSFLIWPIQLTGSYKAIQLTGSYKAAVCGLLAWHDPLSWLGFITQLSVYVQVGTSPLIWHAQLAGSFKVIVCVPLPRQDPLSWLGLVKQLSVCPGGYFSPNMTYTPYWVL